MTLAYVGIGSNIDKHSNIKQAIQALSLLGGDVRLSPIYESPSLGFEGPSFFNLIVELTTSLPLAEFSQCLRTIELDCGREIQAKKFQNRTIDLDIILFGNQISTESPKVPREDIYRYPFVIQPLCDLCPDLIVPNDGRTVQQILQTAEPLSGLSPVKVWF
jgi:2-amino-4-hydroxy-6-hydroxymethyldihydropteridine diphosphokinase